MQDYFAERMNLETVYGIERALFRIADALELLTCDKHHPIARIKDEPLTMEDIISRIPAQSVYKEHIARIVFQHQDEHPKEIFSKLVRAGIYSTKTYWKDVAVLRFVYAKYAWDIRSDRPSIGTVGFRHT